MLAVRKYLFQPLNQYQYYNQLSEMKRHSMCPTFSCLLQLQRSYKEFKYIQSVRNNLPNTAQFQGKQRQIIMDKVLRPFKKTLQKWTHTSKHLLCSNCKQQILNNDYFKADAAMLEYFLNNYSQFLPLKNKIQAFNAQLILFGETILCKERGKVITIE